MPKQQLASIYMASIDVEVMAQLLDVPGVECRRQGRTGGRAVPPDMSAERADLPVEGAEIVPPLRDAVGLVDYDQADFVSDALEDEL